jgi:hypothetical protein
MTDRAVAAALEYAEQVESPAERGGVLISIWFDAADEGNLRHRSINETRELAAQLY